MELDQAQDGHPTTIVSETQVDSLNSAPFEGPEKLLEIWFAASAEDVEGHNTSEDGRYGLRKIDRKIWEQMLDIVKCKVLSVIQGKEIDAYLLSESSLFISPHKLILKTCGTTLNLLGLPRILEIAKEHSNFTTVWRCFYSRKSFMFPERQSGPHKEWRAEVEFLDKLFANGSAYTVGKVNGDHWLLYMTSPVDDEATEEGEEGEAEPEPEQSSSPNVITPPIPDLTIEILMSKLSANARRHFFFPSIIPSSDEPGFATPHHAHASKLSSELGITSLFPPSQTTLDAFAFEPCGYSSNALVQWGDTSKGGNGGEGYYTIHVTPEEGWSYASFECNVPLAAIGGEKQEGEMPDLEALIQRVLKIFQPGHLSVTLFVSSMQSNDTPVETAQSVFHRALTPAGFKRTDKINYEFDGYDLAFASFEKKGHERRRSHPVGQWSTMVIGDDGKVIRK
ncbi:spermidine resistance protein [Tulasnella sp. 419]|nr:spermidine resistance protein [Tulasnella sp. 418]KAG8965855.1 spermidine resistance protein [Tulasnella sp. 419]